MNEQKAEGPMGRTPGKGGRGFEEQSEGCLRRNSAWRGRDGTQELAGLTARPRAALGLVENPDQRREFNSTNMYGTYSVQRRGPDESLGTALSWQPSVAPSPPSRVPGQPGGLERLQGKAGAEDPSDALACGDLSSEANWAPPSGKELAESDHWGYCPG